MKWTQRSVSLAGGEMNKLNFVRKIKTANVTQTLYFTVISRGFPGYLELTETAL